MTIGQRIKNRRIELGMTQDELAKKCGYKSRSSINKIELARDLPIKKITYMANALDCEPSFLMGWDELEHDLEEATILGSIPKDRRFMNYVKTAWSLPEHERENLYKYIDFLTSSNH